MLSSTVDRVPGHTDKEINEAIEIKTRRNIEYYLLSDRDKIGQRLKELDLEWDIERVLEMNAAVFSVLGVLFGIVGKRRWLLLPFAVGGYLAQHALLGWCPPLSLFRRLGFRTRREIDNEREALKVLRGDFRDLPEKNKTSSEQASEFLLAQQK